MKVLCVPQTAHHSSASAVSIHWLGLPDPVHLVLHCAPICCLPHRARLPPVHHLPTFQKGKRSESKELLQMKESFRFLCCFCMMFNTLHILLFMTVIPLKRLILHQVYQYNLFPHLILKPNCSHSDLLINKHNVPVELLAAECVHNEEPSLAWQEWQNQLITVQSPISALIAIRGNLAISKGKWSRKTS